MSNEIIREGLTKSNRKKPPTQPRPTIPPTPQKSAQPQYPQPKDTKPPKDNH